MSFVIASPELLDSAASNFAKIGSTLSSANAAALAPTTTALAPAADAVSAAVAEFFGGHGQDYQAIGTQAATFHDQFVQLIKASSGKFALAEAANAAPLQSIGESILGAINGPTALLSHPLIGTGVAGTGQLGASAGSIFGSSAKVGPVGPVGTHAALPSLGAPAGFGEVSAGSGPSSAPGLFGGGENATVGSVRAQVTADTINPGALVSTGGFGGFAGSGGQPGGPVGGGPNTGNGVLRQIGLINTASGGSSGDGTANLFGNGGTGLMFGPAGTIGPS